MNVKISLEISSTKQDPCNNINQNKYNIRDEL